MSIEYQDGSFSETLPYKKIMERFQREMDEGKPIRALHFGTFADIEALKEKMENNPLYDMSEVEAQEIIDEWLNEYNNRLQSIGQNDAPGE